MKPTIAILGASEQRHKFGNKAVRAYLRQGWDVYPVNPRSTTIEGLPAFRSLGDVPLADLDRVSIYLPPEVGVHLLDDIAGKRCKEVWLNPGAASAELVQRGKQRGLKFVLGCSIVAVGVSPDELD